MPLDTFSMHIVDVAGNRLQNDFGVGGSRGLSVDILLNTTVSPVSTPPAVLLSGSARLTTTLNNTTH